MRGTRWLVVLLLAALVPQAANALIDLPPNRLRNSGFDDHIGGWTGGLLQATWADDVDVLDDPTSGSLRFEVNGEAGAVREVRACVPIVGGELHVVGANYFIPSGQVPSGEAIVLATWYDEPDCQEDMGANGIPSLQDHGVVGAWTSLVISATPPVNADSASLRLAGWKLVGQENQPDFVIYFDDALLLPEANGVIAACITLLLLRRARR